MDVPDELLEDARTFLKSALTKVENETKTGAKGGRTADIAAALACGIHDERLKQRLKHCRTELRLGRDVQLDREELAHYYFAQVMYKLGEKGWGTTFEDEPETNLPSAWSGYRSAAIFDHLQRSQNKDGSWPAPVATHVGLGVGPVYSTALWCTVLQFDKENRPHPAQELKRMKPKVTRTSSR